MKRWAKRFLRFNAVLVILGLIFGITSFSPTVNAKTNYKTLSFDETVQDVGKGEFKNTRINKTADGVEVGSSDGKGKGEYIAPVSKAPFRATHIGLHWKEKEAGKNLVTAYIRTSKDGENFGEWKKISVESDEGRDDKKNKEVFGALVGAEENSFAQAKFEFNPTKETSPELTSITLTFINSGEESKQVTNELSLVPNSIASVVGTLKTSPHGQNINVISREEWGADESLRLTRKGTEDWPRSYHGTRKIVVHHTAVASSNGVTDLETNKAEIRAIYYYHAITQQWGDIGYNALVDAAGNVYEGRYGTHDNMMRINPIADQIMTLDVEAGHTAGYNSGSFGVSAMGDFTNEDITPAQAEGLKNVLAYVADSRGIDVQGSSDYRRYDGTWHTGLNNVIAHRDATATACPGDMLYAQVTTIKTAVDNLLDVATSNLSNFSATLNSNPISGTSIGLGTINFSWSAFSGATQYQYALERVFGTPGVASDSEPWKTAWLNPENTNTMKTTTDTSVQIDAGTLQANSNYVFYVRALGISENPISTVSHVNFTKDGSVALDIESPIVTISNPTNGASFGTGTFSINASATDNVKVTSMKLYIDGSQKATSSVESLSYNWNTKRVSVGLHTINVEAYDAAGNGGKTTITVTRVK